MPLSTDQRATLELVLGRGQSYADLGELLGASEDDVRERARSALAELAGTDPDRNVALTDYLLGQADPIARADAVRHLREDADDHRLASELVADLKALVPDAQLPRLPGEPRAGRFLRGDPGRPSEPAGDGAGSAAPETPHLDRRQSRLIVALAAGAVLVVAAVLALTGTFSGGDDPAPEPAAEQEQPATPGLEEIVLDAPGETVLRGQVDLDDQPDGADPNEVQVPLSAVGGADGRGEATLGLTGQDTLFVDLELGGLERAGDDQTYVLWLMLDGQRGWPLAPIEADRDGSFSERLDVPASLLPVVAQMQFVSVELTDNDSLTALIEGAVGDLGVPEAGDGGGAPGGEANGGASEE